MAATPSNIEQMNDILGDFNVLNISRLSDSSAVVQYDNDIIISEALHLFFWKYVVKLAFLDKYT